MRVLSSNEIKKTSGGLLNFVSWFNDRFVPKPQTSKPTEKDQVSVCWFDGMSVDPTQPETPRKKS